MHTDVARIEREQRSSRALLNALMDRAPDAPLGPPEDLTVTPTQGRRRAGAERRREPAGDWRGGARRCGEARRCSTARADRRGSRASWSALDYWYMPMGIETHHGYGAMVAINLPWLSGRRRDEVREGEQAVQAEQHALASTRNAVRYELRDAAARLDSARQSFTHHRPEPAGAGQAQPGGDAGGVRVGARRRDRRCSTRSGRTCRCGSNACARWRSWRRARRISSAPPGRWLCEGGAR